MSESFAELFEESLVNQNMKPGSIIAGTVVEIGRDFVVVNAGLKSEGVIPVAEFYNDSGEMEVGVGDVVAVHVIARPHSGVDMAIPLGRSPEASQK